MCGSTPSAPTPPPVAPEAPRASDAGAGGQSAEARRRAQATRTASRSGTLLTGARGLTQPATTTQKTLLGS